jgi:hypothetical protein
MREQQSLQTLQDLRQLESLIAYKVQLLSRTRVREDHELIEVQISDLERRRRELAVLVPEGIAAG